MLFILQVSILSEQMINLTNKCDYSGWHCMDIGVERALLNVRLVYKWGLLIGSLMNGGSRLSFLE